MIIKSRTKQGKAGRLWVFAGIILVAIASYFIATHWLARKAVAPVALNKFPVSGNVQEPEMANVNGEEETEAPLPPTKLLPVPFTPQAPTANWDELHNEACEEASALMADAYFSGNHESTLSPEYAEAEIAKLTEWEKQNFGYYLSITTEEAAKMMEEVYGLSTIIVQFPSPDELKRQLADGNLVILPANGQLLGNPNYKQPGPIYHMLVIKGYDRIGFITNDPGTKRGLNYAYDYDTLKNAAGTWNHAEHAVNLNEKSVIIVYKE